MPPRSPAYIIEDLHKYQDNPDRDASVKDLD